MIIQNELKTHKPWAAYLFYGAVIHIVAWLTVPVLKSLSEEVSACQNIQVLHLSMPSQCIMSHVSCRAHNGLPVCSTSIYTVCDVPAGLLHWAIAQLTIPVLCMFVPSVCHNFCGLRSRSHSYDCRVHATAPCFVRVFAQARPTVSCIPLALLLWALYIQLHKYTENWAWSASIHICVAVLLLQCTSLYTGLGSFPLP